MLTNDERKNAKEQARKVLEREPNKATLLANLHLGNDFSLYMECRRLAREALEEWRDNYPVSHLADALKEYLGTSSGMRRHHLTRWGFSGGIW